MADINFFAGSGPYYDNRCKDFTLALKNSANKLHQEVEGSKIGDDPYNYYVPPENWDEAERRVSFVYSMISKYRKFLHSNQPLYHFSGMVRRKLAKIERDIATREAQIAFDFIGNSDIETMKAEKNELDEILFIIQNPRNYFEAPHHVKS